MAKVINKPEIDSSEHMAKVINKPSEIDSITSTRRTYQDRESKLVVSGERFSIAGEGFRGRKGASSSYGEAMGAKARNGACSVAKGPMQAEAVT